MGNHDICKQAHEDMHEIIKMWEKGENMNSEMMLAFLVNRALCMDSLKEERWKGYHEDVLGAQYPKEKEYKVHKADEM